MATEKISNPMELFITKQFSHAYSISASQSGSWNPHDDSGFDVQGYTPIGIIEFKTNAAEVFIINLSLQRDRYGIFLRNMASSAKSGDFEYTVLYKKS